MITSRAETCDYSLRGTALQRMAKKVLFRVLGDLQEGLLQIHEAGEIYEFGMVAEDGLRAEIIVQAPGMYADVLFGGSIGAAESYMRGDWETTDLTAVVRVLCRNLQVLDGMDSGWASLTKPFAKMIHAMRRNTRDGSKRNIAAHYDLSNQFFAAWLDAEMMYSAAVFPKADADLDQAAIYKLDRICRKLDLQVDDHVLEIGTGWGGFAVYAAKHYGCRVTTTTISKAQFDKARERIERAGLGDRITLLLLDYRDLQPLDGKGFDKLVSIEMIEAVGHDFLQTYAQQCARLLKEDGAALIQAITIPDDRYRTALREVDFIKRYIFPGSFIPSVSAILGTLPHTDLRLAHFEDLTPHYAETLKHWHHKYRGSLANPATAQFDQRFQKMWSFYLSYCEGGFWERVIGSAQFLFHKPKYHQRAATPNIEGLAYQPQARVS